MSATTEKTDAIIMSLSSDRNTILTLQALSRTTNMLSGHFTLQWYSGSLNTTLFVVLFVCLFTYILHDICRYLVL